MVVIKEIPKCTICGEIIAKAIYKTQSNVSPDRIIYGDNFSHWEYLKHKCKYKLNIKNT